MQRINTSPPGSAGMNAERLARIPAFFRRYLDERQLAGYAALITRRGKVVFRCAEGVKDWDSGEPITPDTIYRIYSMTKPITSVALMMLCEEGAIRPEHEVARYIPSFAGLQVFDGGDAESYRTRPPTRPMRVHDLLTHTSGLTYGFMHQHPVDALYRRRGLGDWGDRGETLEEFVEALSGLPLLFSPGDRWNYSVSTDVCGRLVEIVSGERLDDFLHARILAPLGMHDTAFAIDDAKLPRLAACYEKVFGSKRVRRQDGVEDSSYRGVQSYLSGGGGLLSTLDDYLRFCRMLANGGALNGVRLLSPRTVSFMTRNHLSGNRTIAEMGDSLFTETQTKGSGFGLGFSVVLDPVESLSPASAGSYSWGGMASTWFWIDPAEDLIGVFMTQLIPSSAYPLRQELQTLVYAAIED
jgi:CubicO group peptidase (beta-lactamase class C family)